MSAAIPTEFRGIMFRSRLEARWAAAFDALKWPWEYEPLDLEGYIPDFVLSFARPLLVEIKPTVALEPWTEAERKIERSGWDGEAMILGTGSLWATKYPIDMQPAIGRFGERVDGSWQWDSARLFWCSTCGKPSVLSEGGSWQCRRSGCAPGGGNEHLSNAFAWPSIWAEAGNLVQWHAEEVRLCREWDEVLP